MYEYAARTAKTKLFEVCVKIGDCYSNYYDKVYYFECFFFFFFFQAEDGIRDGTVTGVQTCAPPISEPDIDVGGAAAAGRMRHLRQRQRRADPEAEKGVVAGGIGHADAVKMKCPADKPVSRAPR